MGKACCCVPGCLERDLKTHRFPLKNHYLFEDWVSRVNHPRFASLTKQHIYKNYAVCEKHFLENDKEAFTKRGLKPTAIPVLYMPGTALDPLNVGDVNPQPTASTSNNPIQNIEYEEEIAIKQEEDDDDISDSKLDCEKENDETIALKKPKIEDEDNLVSKEFAKNCLKYALQYLEQQNSDKFTEDVANLNKLLLKL